LPFIAKPGRTKALFVSRFSPEVTANDVHKTLKEQLRLKWLICTKLKTKLFLSHFGDGRRFFSNK
jgi:hypothetical protein